MNKIKEWIMFFVINQALKTEGVVKVLTNIKNAIAGKKTYIVAISAIIGVILAWSNGTMGDAEAIKAIIEAILAVTIRAGVSKVQ